MMKMSVEATAPGKAILFGEHSVVYRGPAVVLAIDKRARVVAERTDDDKIFFDALDLGFSGFFDGETYYAVKGESWRGRRLLAFLVAARKTMEHLDTESGLNITSSRQRGDRSSRGGGPRRGPEPGGHLLHRI